MMTIKQYQELALITFQVEKNKMKYLKLGIRGESGEVCDKVKKLIRDDHWEPGLAFPEDKKIGLIKELGDVMWYAVVDSHENLRPVSWSLGSDSIINLNDVQTFDKQDLTECAIDLYDMMAQAHINTWEVVICIATMCKIIGTTLEDVCRINIEKLKSRLERDQIKGSGDNR